MPGQSGATTGQLSTLNQLESLGDAERRLMQKFNLTKRELFQSDAEILTEAYRRQGEKIAYERKAGR